jgi:hypothetical protein
MGPMSQKVCNYFEIWRHSKWRTGREYLAPAFPSTKINF